MFTNLPIVTINNKSYVSRAKLAEFLGVDRKTIVNYMEKRDITNYIIQTEGGHKICYIEFETAKEIIKKYKPDLLETAQTTQTTQKEIDQTPKEDKKEENTTTNVQSTDVPNAGKNKPTSKFVEDKEELKKVVDPKNLITLAHQQAKEGWITNDKEILMLGNKDGLTVAHYQAIYSKWVTEDKEILKLRDMFDVTIAHEQTKRGWTTNDKEILVLVDVWGRSVAHYQAMYSGWTTDDVDILMLTDEDGISVAHIQAEHGWMTDNEKILKLCDNQGRTVAHIQAENFWITNNPKILFLTDGKGRTVRSIIEKNLQGGIMLALKKGVTLYTVCFDTETVDTSWLGKELMKILDQVKKSDIYSIYSITIGFPLLNDPEEVGLWLKLDKKTIDETDEQFNEIEENKWYIVGKSNMVRAFPLNAVVVRFEKKHENGPIKIITSFKNKKLESTSKQNLENVFLQKPPVKSIEKKEQITFKKK